jgi:hypothetical protein
MTPATPVHKFRQHFTFDETDNHDHSSTLNSAHVHRRPINSSMRRNSIVSHRRESYIDVRRESFSHQHANAHETNAEVFTTPESLRLLKGFCLSITYGACIGKSYIIFA